MTCAQGGRPLDSSEQWSRKRRVSGGDYERGGDAMTINLLLILVVAALLLWFLLFRGTA